MKWDDVMCEICDEPGTTSVYHGVIAHRKCVPSHWRKDHEEQAEFMARFREWWAAAPPWKRDWDGQR